VTGVEHLPRLRRIKTILDGKGQYDTSRTTLACYGGAGFTPELTAAARAGQVVLVGLDELYGGQR
jgi:uncharacterized protein